MTKIILNQNFTNFSTEFELLWSSSRVKKELFDIIFKKD